MQNSKCNVIASNMKKANSLSVNVILLLFICLFRSFYAIIRLGFEHSVPHLRAVNEVVDQHEHSRGTSTDFHAHLGYVARCRSVWCQSEF